MGPHIHRRLRRQKPVSELERPATKVRGKPLVHCSGIPKGLLGNANSFTFFLLTSTWGRARGHARYAGAMMHESATLRTM
jgi:hypothetical protein